MSLLLSYNNYLLIPASNLVTFAVISIIHNFMIDHSDEFISHLNIEMIDNWRKMIDSPIDQRSIEFKDFLQFPYKIL